MKMFRTAILIALLAPPSGAGAQSSPVPRVGAEYEITKSYQTSQKGSDGSSGSSSGRNVVIERVLAARDDGLELEYDLPKDASAEERRASWQFPVRVFRPTHGPIRLLNRDELEGRVETWLKAAGWTRAVCGRWIFTWNAFLIDCNPESTISTLQAYDLRFSDLREGAPYHDAEALAPEVLVRKAAGPNAATFTAVMTIDPESVRRARAELDVAIGEIMQKPMTLDAALHERGRERVSGTITITLEADSAGNVKRRTKVTRVETRLPNGDAESHTSTETVERRLLSGLSAKR